MISRAPAAPLLLTDRHDAALYAWRQAGLRNRILVHIDAHPDVAPDQEIIDSGNFIWWALTGGIVDRVFWVVPDPAWQAVAERAAVRQLLLQRGSGAVESDAAGFRTTVAGRPFTACPIDGLPRELGPVLLDIDVDYFVVPTIRRPRPPRDAWPWISPEELLRRCAGAAAAPQFITIATSTRGGYTPLRWKFLGAELAARLNGDLPRAQRFDDLRSALAFARDGHSDEAIAVLRRTVAADASIAGAWYALATTLAAAGSMTEARSAYRRALALDPDYRSPDSDARALFESGDVAAALREYERISALDPDDPWAWLGRAEAALSAGRIEEALATGRRALDMMPDQIDTHRLVARALARRGDVDGAIKHYERSQLLAVGGQVPLDGPIASHTFGRPVDHQHYRTYGDLARLYRTLGSRRSLGAFEMALRGESHRLDLHLLLILEYLRYGRRLRAMAQALQAVRAVPSAARAVRARVSRRLRASW